MRGSECSYDDAGDTIFGMVRDNKALVHRLRQNVFALARHLQLSPSELKRLAQHADELTTSAAAAVPPEDRLAERRRSLHDILLDPSAPRTGSNTPPRSVSPEATKSLSPPPPEQVCSSLKRQRGLGELPPASSLAASPRSESRAGSEPTGSQLAEVATASYYVSARLPPRDSPAYLRSTIVSFTRRHRHVAAPQQLQQRQQTVPALTAVGDRFHEFRLPVPRPSFEGYIGVGPTLVAYVVSGAARV
ncbi:hypothetical protein JCM8202v2_000065 [Rhodotorula sphaerocarpa]